MKQRFNIGHAHHTKADRPARAGIGLCMRLMCPHHGCLQLLRVFGIPSGTPRFSSQLQRQQCASATYRRSAQGLHAPIYKRHMLCHEGRGFCARQGAGAKFIDPQTGHIREGRLCLCVRSTVGSEDLTPVPIGFKHALYQGWRHGCRRNQHARAQHANPVHQAGKRRQVRQVKVVQLIQDDVTAKQAQHGGDLASGALGFRSGHEVVNGAHQYRSGKQGANALFLQGYAQ